MKFSAITLVAILATMLLTSCGPHSRLEFSGPMYPLGYGMEKYGRQLPKDDYVIRRADFFPEDLSSETLKVCFLPVLTKDGPENETAQLLVKTFEHDAHRTNLLATDAPILLKGENKTFPFLISEEAIVALGEKAKADFVVVCRVEQFDAEFVNVQSMQATRWAKPEYPGDFRCRGYLKGSTSVYRVKTRELVAHSKKDRFFDVDSRTETAEESREAVKESVLATLLRVPPYTFLTRASSPYRVQEVVEEGKQVVVALPKGHILRKDAKMRVTYLIDQENRRGERALGVATSGLFELERQKGQKAWFRLRTNLSVGIDRVRVGQFASIQRHHIASVPK